MANPKKIKVIVKEINKHGKGIYIVTMTCPDFFPRFKYGQFLHLALDDFDLGSGYWPESRVFSIAHVSEDRKEVSIVYSVKGAFTKLMEQQLTPGRELWLKAPYGEFIISNFINDGDKIVLIAGGTGISPFLSYLLNCKNDNEIVINYGIRNIEDIIFLSDLSKISMSTNVQMNIFIENEGVLPKRLKTSYCIHEKLCIDTINNISCLHGKEKYFISGPPNMISSFKSDLSAQGVENKNIIIDEWG